MRTDLVCPLRRGFNLIIMLPFSFFSLVNPHVQAVISAVALSLCNMLHPFSGVTSTTSSETGTYSPLNQDNQLVMNCVLFESCSTGCFW